MKTMLFDHIFLKKEIYNCAISKVFYHTRFKQDKKLNESILSIKLCKKCSIFVFEGVISINV